MELHINWQNPVVLTEDPSRKLIYTCELDDIPAEAGVYVFARRYGDAQTPLYIGQSENVRKRIKQHFKKNVPLMNGIKNSQNGQKVILVGIFEPRSAQQIERCLPILEKALMDSALAEGYELLNIRGTRQKTHTISMSGTKKSHNPFARKLFYDDRN